MKYFYRDFLRNYKDHTNVTRRFRRYEKQTRTKMLIIISCGTINRIPSSIPYRMKAPTISIARDVNAAGDDSLMTDND